MLLAASGPSGVETDPRTQENAELNLWSFKLKKYKYCNWSIARMLGTFDLPLKVRKWKYKSEIRSY
jgi:hypothetical protein